MHNGQSSWQILIALSFFSTGTIGATQSEKKVIGWIIPCYCSLSNSASTLVHIAYGAALALQNKGGASGSTIIFA